MEVPPLRVLVVDDNDDSAISLGTLINLWGHQAKTAFSGYGAHSLAKEFLPQVAIIDLAMPGMSGLQLASRFCEDETLADCWRIALSGHTDKAVQNAARQAGFHFYLFKPPEPTRLENLLATLARGAQGQIVSAQGLVDDTGRI